MGIAMKYLNGCLALVLLSILSGVLLSKLLTNIVDNVKNTPKEEYCKQLKVWHPDCKVE